MSTQCLLAWGRARRTVRSAMRTPRTSVQPHTSRGRRARDALQGGEGIHSRLETVKYRQVEFFNGTKKNILLTISLEGSAIEEKNYFK